MAFLGDWDQKTIHTKSSTGDNWNSWNKVHERNLLWEYAKGIFSLQL